jgi:membrane protease YdiL (CAAX protease family)
LYHGAPLTPGRAAGLTAAAIGTLYVVQLVLAIAGVPDLLASIVSDVAALAVVLGYARRLRLRLADLGLRRAAPRFLVAAVLLGVSMWLVTAVIVELVKPPGSTEGLQKLVEQTPLLPTFVALTIFPAIAEELVFRGVLTRALAGRLRADTAIVISAVAFGVYHINPSQMLSTFVLGLVLGFLTLRAASIVPAMIVHFLNNSIAVLLARDELPGVGSFIDDHAGYALAIALVCVAAGIGLAARGGA